MNVTQSIGVDGHPGNQYRYAIADMHAWDVILILDALREGEHVGRAELARELEEALVEKGWLTIVRKLESFDRSKPD